jgi:hypothetical protein
MHGSAARPTTKGEEVTILKRQGDILLQLTEIGELAPRDSLENIADGVIARGEVTGHAHRVVGGTLYSQYGTLRVVAEEGTKVVHDEHADLELEPGIWLVRNQEEYAGDGQMTGVYD